MYEETMPVSTCSFLRNSRQQEYVMNGIAFLAPTSQFRRQNLNRLVAQAATIGYEENVMIIIDCGASPNVALTAAIQNGQLDLCRRILCEYDPKSVDKASQILKAGHIADVFKSSTGRL